MFARPADCIRRQGDHRRVDVGNIFERAHLLQSLNAVEGRHPVVEEDYVELLCLDEIETFKARLRRRDLNARLLEQSLDDG